MSEDDEDEARPEAGREAVALIRAAEAALARDYAALRRDETEESDKQAATIRRMRWHLEVTRGALEALGRE